MPSATSSETTHTTPRWLVVLLVVVAVALVGCLGYMLSTLHSSVGGRPDPTPTASATPTATAWSMVVRGAGTLTDVATEPDGSVVAIGTITSAEGAPASDPTFPVSASAQQAIVVNFNANGTLRWAKALAGDGPVQLNDVEIAPDGNIAVTGYASASQTNIPNVGTAGADSTFLAMLTPAGAITWATTLATRPPTDDLGASGNPFFSVAIASNGAVVALGTDDLSVGGINATSFTASGTKQWSAVVTTDVSASIIAVAPGTDGSVLAVMAATVSADGTSAPTVVPIGPDGQIGTTTALQGDTAIGSVAVGSDGTLVTTAASSNGTTVTERSASGVVAWQARVTLPSTCGLQAVTVAPDGGVIAVGDTYSPTHASNDAFIVKLTSTGTIAWQRNLGGTGNDAFNDVALTRAGTIAVIGTTSSHDGDFPPAPDGAGDAFIAVLNADGSPATH